MGDELTGESGYWDSGIRFSADLFSPCRCNGSGIIQKEYYDLKTDSYVLKVEFCPAGCLNPKEGDKQ